MAPAGRVIATGGFDPGIMARALRWGGVPYVSALRYTSQISVKSLSASGCGPLVTMCVREMNSPGSRSNVLAMVMIPASRKSTPPCGVWTLSGSPLYVETKVIVPAVSSMIGGGPLDWPAADVSTDLPVAGLVIVLRMENVFLKLSSVYSV